MADFAVEFDTKLPDVVVSEIIKLAHDYPVKDGTVFKPDGEVGHLNTQEIHWFLIFQLMFGLDQ